MYFQNNWAKKKHKHLPTAFIQNYIRYILTSPHLSLNHEGRWGTTDDFITSFLHFTMFSTALWDLANSRPVHFLILSSHLFFCLPCLLPPFTVPCKIVSARSDERETRPHYCSLRPFTMVSRVVKKNTSHGNEVLGTLRVRNNVDSVVMLSLSDHVTKLRN